MTKEQKKLYKKWKKFKFPKKAEISIYINGKKQK